MNIENLKIRKKKNYSGTLKPQDSGTNLVSLNAQTSHAFDYTKVGEDGFDVEFNIRNLLQKLPNEQAVQQFQTQLSDAKDETARELQRNVYRNYTEFVVISKEITDLEGDISNSKKIFSEMEHCKKYFSQAAGISNSIKILNHADFDEHKPKHDAEVKTRREEMKLLFKDIDGLQKQLPENPLRELLHNGSRAKTFEINQKNYKPKDQVYFYVMSDYLVVCTSKKNMITGKYRMMVDKAFPIDDIGFIDMKDTMELSHAFQIMRRAESLLYMAESLQEKRSLLDKITKITSLILQARRRELDQKKMTENRLDEAQKSVKPVFMTSPIVKKEIFDGLSNADYAWMVELPDELDVLIAHRDFGHAISLIEKARSIITSSIGETSRLQTLRKLLDIRTKNVARLISNELTSPGATKTEIQEDIQRLLRLGLGDQARDIYLTNCSTKITHKLRQIQFNGNIVSFILEYSDVFFGLLKHTCEWFGSSFDDPSMASGFMKWMQDQIAQYAKIFKRQVFDMNYEFSIVAECVMTAIEKCQEMSEVGMDMSFTFEKLIGNKLVELIQKHAQNCNRQVLDSIRDARFDKPTMKKSVFDDAQLQVLIPNISDAASNFFSTLSTFSGDIGVFVSFTLYNEVVEALGTFFKTFTMEIKEIALKEFQPVNEYLFIDTDATFVIDVLFPHTISQLEERFERDIPELQKELKESKSI